MLSRYYLLEIASLTVKRPKLTSAEFIHLTFHIAQDLHHNTNPK